MHSKKLMISTLVAVVSLFAATICLQGCGVKDDTNLLVSLDSAIQGIGMKYGNAIVVIDVETMDSQDEGEGHGECHHRFGSGFVYNSDGIIVTTDALIGTGGEYRVITQNNEQFEATLIGRDFETNVAILKIDTTGIASLPLAGSNSNSGCLGIIIGNTYYSQGLACGWGIVNHTWIGGGDFLDNKLLSIHLSWPEVQSGTPILNSHGQLLGIAEGHMEDMESAWTIIPSSTIVQVADRLISEGKIVRGWFGIKSDPVCPKLLVLALIHDWKGKGVVISDVIPGSPAELAGIHVGDIVVKLNDQTIKCISDFRSRVTSLSPETNIILEIVRGEHQMKIDSSLETIPLDPDRQRRSLSRSA